MQIYSPVLPPPAPPASTPSVPSTPHLQLNLNVLNSALESSKPRPPPLVWESSNEHIQKGAPTTRSQKKAVEVKDEDGTVDEHEPAAPPAKRLRLSTKTARGIDTVARGMLHLETKASDKLCRIKHKRLAWSEPAHPARHFPVTALPLKDPPHLVVHSSRYQSLVALSAWKGQTRDTDCLNRSRSSCFPLSAVRDEPNHRQPYSSRPFAPAFHEPSFRSFTFPRPQFDLGTVASSSATASPSRSSWPSDFGFHQHHYRNGESSTPSSSETLQCA
ncbi:transcription factor [Rhodotorula toruloides]|uniref:Transcription factor n=1 Tax=Rhodotorula toruloides TaxID=5286 RepID=A0A511KAK6_RHOTO|nr:transcription factor [Rhodotorula toruloides]